ncbi:hypothetical protein [Pontibacter arcticus]|uniref:hypothetical protein n=1 Tax=Pontibacter arcticus TaxID=2080288 RepID=UPI001403FF5B|nr:hypothetical protein [Pontibacter arcticus]
MTGKKEQQIPQGSILNPEQEALLDLYIRHLDTYFESIKTAEKIQVEIETQHLKKILTK